ncbi:hypothetical protein L7F22_054921 [Adiantum nelumboides]|nr:hypothetical protein [Adiantum nelumboides]
MGRHPEVKWAQRSDKVLITIDLPDAKDPKVKIEPEGRLCFFATGYELDFDLFDKINVEVVKTPSRALSSKGLVAFGHDAVNDAKGKSHVDEQPLVSIGHRQPSTHGLVNGQDSNEQTMRQTIPMPMSNAGCFGGSSNPMYGNIGVQPGFQCAAGSYGMPGANMGMTGFSQPYAQNLNMTGSARKPYFVPARKKIKSEHMVKLFMHNIFKYHGMPQSIVSGRDPRMTSLFWKALFEDMGIMLKFSSSFHPQLDGQSEEANSTILDLLKCYVLEHKATWERYLPLVEYAYNNTMHTSTGKDAKWNDQEALITRFFACSFIQESKTSIGLRNVFCALVKGDKGWWKRLLKNEGKPPPYLKVDWDKWVDEDEEDETKNDFNNFDLGSMGDFSGFNPGGDMGEDEPDSDDEDVMEPPAENQAKS